jgi:ABC-type uncharacterized transport system fused permease/ATPase subunit
MMKIPFHHVKREKEKEKEGENLFRNSLLREKKEAEKIGFSHHHRRHRQRVVVHGNRII